jgi:putative membrane protein
MPGIQSVGQIVKEEEMTINHVIAALHLITLGIGYGFAWMRGKQISLVQSKEDLSSVFFADNMYGLAALLWLATGLWRAFGGLEKGTDYYLESTAFWIKMGLFGVLFILEIYPMITLMQWRIKRKKGKDFSLSPTRTLSLLTYAEVVLLTAMVFVAVMMARGMWY